MLALITSIACGVFSLGICHIACAILHRLKHKSKKELNERDKKTLQLGNSLGEKSLAVNDESKHLGSSNINAKPNKIEFKLPPKVKKTLDTLFENSPLSIDQLPIYPIILEKGVEETFKREKMSAPIMKGISKEGHRFILIKVDCTLTDENIEKTYLIEEIKNEYKNGDRLIQDLIILSQPTPGPLFWGGEGELTWEQLFTNGLFKPYFFNSNITDPKSGELTNSQVNNFKTVQSLLKDRQAKDLNGLLWQIPEE